MGNKLVTGDPRVWKQERVEAGPRVLERGGVGIRRWDPGGRCYGRRFFHYWGHWKLTARDICCTFASLSSIQSLFFLSFFFFFQLQSMWDLSSLTWDQTCIL